MIDMHDCLSSSTTFGHSGPIHLFIETIIKLSIVFFVGLNHISLVEVVRSSGPIRKFIQPFGGKFGRKPGPMRYFRADDVMA